MENTVFLQAASSCEAYKDNHVVFLNIESIIIYSIYKYCAPENLALHLVFSKKPTTTSDLMSIIIKDERVAIEQFEGVPWEAALCTFPVAKCEDTVISGMCGVARHICKFRTSVTSPAEHEEGLLGFRQSCLQAPNEVSVWTKFCEVDIIKTIKQIVSGEHDAQFPVNVGRFENHLKKPVKIHNVYKIARNGMKNVCEEQNKELTLKSEDADEEKVSVAQESLDKTKSRIGKNRKWKSVSNESRSISSSTPIEDLNVNHEFAEGPFLTLADLVLYPCFIMIAEYYGKQFTDKMPLISHWLNRLNKINSLKSTGDIIKQISILNKIKPSDTPNIVTPQVSDVSLYKCDPKRHNPKKRLFTKEEDIEEALSVLMHGMELSIDNCKVNKELDWDHVPAGANPRSGHLPDKRMDRKCQQLENLALAVLKVAQKGDLIVDFCSGSGHLGILVAHLLPESTVILLENKEQSLSRARARVRDMCLTNVYFFQCNLDFFVGKFDVGLALHACGIASDLVLDKCLNANAKFIICPCCYGSLHSTDRLPYPRSSHFSSVSIDRYMCIGHAADQTHSEHPLAVRGARCMAVIDSDRARLAEERGYKVTLTRLKPLTCTPKNNLLIGIPTGL